MIRLATFATSLMFVSVAAAQVVPPTPPAPPAPSTPVVSQPPPAPRAPRAPMAPPAVFMPEVMVPPVIAPMVELPELPLLPEILEPALAPMAPLPMLPPMVELPQTPMIAPVARPVPIPDWEIQEAIRAAQDARRIDMDAMRAAQDQAREAIRAAQIDTDRMREDAMRAARAATPVAQGLADMRWSMDHFDMPFAWERNQSADSEGYDNAKRALNAREYDTAITRFDRVIGMKSEHSDAALYWKAFAQFKLGRMDDALGSIQQLRRDYAQSRYIADAKVLEADAKRMSGQNVNPAALDDDEIKLLAIQGIQNTEPERAIPLLEGVLNATNSLRVKQQALYVLALSDRPQAHQILMKYAKGGGTPDLQRSAISYIASRRDKQTTSADLNEIYTSTQDQGVRIAIISAYRAAGDKPALIAIAGNASAPVEVRSVAISNLSGLAAPADLWTLYQKETNADLKMRMISAFSSMRAVDQLSQIAKTEKDPAIRLRAVRALGSQKVEQTGTMLVDIYSTNQDTEVRKAVISALSSQNNAEGLVAIARKEASMELKRDIVARLSNLATNGKNKVAEAYLMEIIK